MHINQARSLRKFLLLFYDVLLITHTYIYTLYSQIAWMNLALVTSTQIMHRAFPALRDWTFVQRRHNRSIDFDEKIFAEFHWCRSRRHRQDIEKKTTLVVVIQPHWVLDEHDMDQFVSCTAVKVFFFSSYSYF
jgi:hypothetical protein